MRSLLIDSRETQGFDVYRKLYDRIQGGYKGLMFTGNFTAGYRERFPALPYRGDRNLAKVPSPSGFSI
jgi:hypothetical protein